MKKLLPSGSPVLLGVSGGVDSMCMAELFLHSSFCVPFSIAHCNFHLRSEESDSDEYLVASWAKRTGVPFYKVDFDTKAYASAHSVSIEMAARELRYDWFSSVCKENGFGYLAIAHNANDNAETLFLNLTRGTGGRGLCGMSESSHLPSSQPSDVLLIRPLLGITRAEISDYARDERIDYHEDSTNALTDVKRNKIRHLVFPVLEEMNPSYIETINKDMAFFRQENDIAEAYFEEHGNEVCESSAPLTINIRKLLALPFWKYLLFRLLEPYSFPSSVFDDLYRLLSSGAQTGGKIFRAGSTRLVATSDRLILSEGIGIEARHKLPSINEAEDFLVVRASGRYLFNGHCFSVSECDVSSAGLKQPEGSIAVDNLSFPFILRRWRVGDWFVPFGSKGRKKLSDFFTDGKFSLLDKADSVVVVKADSSVLVDAVGERVAAILGYRLGKPVFRIDDSLRIASSTMGKVITLKSRPASTPEMKNSL